MNARALRRLAADQYALRSQPLPPNYLFPPGNAAHNDELTSLDILLAGPAHTAFAAGVWKLHLAIPPTYPQTPPTAHFRTPIFHPNVDPLSGTVCVETLKRDWDARLTLRDVLVTISCLLIQPNPDSALNAEAGALLQEEYGAFARRAEMLAGIQAKIPTAMVVAVKEAQDRGNDEGKDEDDGDAAVEEEAPVRRRRTIARVRGKARRDDGSPSESNARFRRQISNEPAATTTTRGAVQQPFIFQSGDDGVFGTGATRIPAVFPKGAEDEDNSMTDADQENDASRSPTKASTPKLAVTPRRPHGTPVPLGELIIEEDESFDTSEDMEPEYPPSPRKSPSKSPAKARHANTIQTNNAQRPESSRHAALRQPNITPPNDIEKPLAEDSPFMGTADFSVSPRKSRHGLFQNPLQKDSNINRNLFGKSAKWETPVSGVLKTKSPSSAEQKRDERRQRAILNAKLWDLCGRDIKRWNVGDFDGEPFKLKAARW